MNFKILSLITLLLASFAMATEKIDTYTEEVAKIGNSIEVAVVIDMSDVNEKLGSYTATLNFNSELYKYDGFIAAEDFSTVVNDQDAKNGKLVFAAANPYGAYNKVQAVTIKFNSDEAIAPSIKLEFSAMAAAGSFKDLTLLLNEQTSALDLGEAIVPGKYKLGNYPNPFNPSTQINFDLPKASEVSIEIFNVLGEKVQSLVESRYEAGSHKVTWNATDRLGNKVPAGTYFVRLKAGETVKNHKVLLIK